MARTLSQDLRDRVVAAIDSGQSCHAAAARSLSPYSPDFNPIEKAFSRLKAIRSRRVEERAADILAVWEARKDISLVRRERISPSKAQHQVEQLQPGSSAHHQPPPEVGNANPSKEVAPSTPASFTSTNSEPEITPDGDPSSVQNGRKPL